MARIDTEDRSVWIKVIRGGPSAPDLDKHAAVVLQLDPHIISERRLKQLAGRLEDLLKSKDVALVSDVGIRQMGWHHSLHCLRHRPDGPRTGDRRESLRPDPRIGLCAIRIAHHYLSAIIFLVRSLNNESDA